MPSMIVTPTRSPTKRRRTMIDVEEEESPGGKEVAWMLLGTPRRSRFAPELVDVEITPTKRPSSRRRSTTPSSKENQPVLVVDDDDDDDDDDVSDEEHEVKPLKLIDPAETLPTPKSTPKHDRFIARPIKDIYSHALQLLSPNGSLASSSSPSASSPLPILGRESQRAELINFLVRRFPAVYPDIAAVTSSPSSLASLYVSGPPGIGKTALLSSVLAEFSSLVEQNGHDDEIKVHMQTCQTSGMGQNGIWDRLGEGLGMEMTLGTGKTKITGKQAFERGLRQGGRFLIVLDEIDHLRSASSSSNLLQALLTIAHAPGSPLTLIGIANTLDLMSRFDLAKTTTTSLVPSWKKAKGTAAAEPTMQQLHFKAYNASEIEAILRQRLLLLADSYPHLSDFASPPVPSSRTELPLLHPAALRLCAMKVAARSGDIRQAFRVAEVCVSSLKKKAKGTATEGANEIDLSAHTPATALRATPSDMNVALKNAGLSVSLELASQLSSLQRNARFVLVSICIALSRDSLAGFEAKALNRSVNVSECYSVYQEMVELDDVMRRSANLSRGDWVDAQGLVEASAFVRTISSGSGAKGRKPKGSPRGGVDAADPMITLSSYGLDEIVEALKTVPAAEGMSAGVLEDTLRISKNMLHWEEGRVLKERNKKAAEQQRDRARDKHAPSEGFHGIGLEKGPVPSVQGKKRKGPTGGKGKWIGRKRKLGDEDEEEDGLVVGADGGQSADAGESEEE